MAQVFSPSADTWFRLVLIGVPLVIVGLLLAGAGLTSSQYQTGEGWTVHQQVPFSHKHHAGELGIDCRYCHTSVETAANAGLPPTQTCMTCHSQIWTDAPMLAPLRASYATGKPLVWQRIAQLPDYVYFDHAVHVKNGVACVECHGRIDRMPLTYQAKPFEMRFCLNCHNDPASGIRPPSQVTRMDWSGYDRDALRRYGASVVRHRGIDPKRLTNCETCHR
jgi:hypothetical protein